MAQATGSKVAVVFSRSRQVEVAAGLQECTHAGDGAAAQTGQVEKENHLTRHAGILRVGAPLARNQRSSNRLGGQPHGRRRDFGKCLRRSSSALAARQRPEAQLASKRKTCLECDSLEDKHQSKNPIATQLWSLSN